MVRLWTFARCVVRNFRRNNGLLLAGAVGYNTLLSIVPLMALVLVVLSAVVDEAVLVEVVRKETDTVFPGSGHAVRAALQSFLEKREVIGTVGFVGMLFFSTIAFRILEDAIATVFHRDRPVHDRHWLRSIILPFGYVASVGLGVLVLTLVMFAFDALPDEGVRVLGWNVYRAQLAAPFVKLLAFGGLVVLLSSFYRLMPGIDVGLKRAFIGGAVAATLWEGVRSILMWYFANLSLVHVIYGSLATVVVVLVGLEIAAIILLLGAEILAELERRRLAGVHWYEEPG
jgi:YihY family inner membrane protein